jgi:hypothetical protein
MEASRPPADAPIPTIGNWTGLSCGISLDRPLTVYLVLSGKKAEKETGGKLWIASIGMVLGIGAAEFRRRVPFSDLGGLIWGCRKRVRLKKGCIFQGVLDHQTWVEISLL